MKRYIPYCLLTTFVFGGTALSNAQVLTEIEAIGETVIEEESVQPLVDPEALLQSLPAPKIDNKIVNMSLMPKVLVGYRKVHTDPSFTKKEFYDGYQSFPVIDGDALAVLANEPTDSLQLFSLEENIQESFSAESNTKVVSFNQDSGELPNLLANPLPEWYESSIRNQTIQEDMIYAYMLQNPSQIEYAYWDLPLPPVLLVEDRSFLAFLRKQEVPEVDPADAVLPEVEDKKVHWLHKFGTQLQFSQAYISPNWYQGGNSYLSLLFNFNWNVQLNQVYHPNILFQSDLSYKVAFSSNPKGYMHKYNIAEDNFQYNLNTGLKAAKNWYYSYNLQFKTQLFNNFEEDSYKRTAAFLSPADLNMGLGMSYNFNNKQKTLQLTLTLSPLSYNLKVCLKPNDIIDHSLYGIAADKKTKSEIGSNIEYIMDWKMTSNISYKTRVFMFTDYHYYMCDWQNTFNFDINKFLSTQLFVNLRYDGSTENYGKWKKFMLREILSFGLSYTFSTKP